MRSVMCRVSMAAKELPDRRIVLQARVSSMLTRPASITQATLSAPAGYEVQEAAPELQSLFPLQVGCLSSDHFELACWTLPEPSHWDRKYIS